MVDNHLLKESLTKQPGPTGGGFGLAGLQWVARWVDRQLIGAKKLVLLLLPLKVGLRRVTVMAAAAAAMAARGRTAGSANLRGGHFALNPELSTLNSCCNQEALNAEQSLQSVCFSTHQL